MLWKSNLTSLTKINDSRKGISELSVKTIRMRPPSLLVDKTLERQPIPNDEVFKFLVSHEAFLRKSAYKNTTLKTDESFFDDSDMKSEYYLIVVYDKTSNTPLLSSRYYFDKSVISTYLKHVGSPGIELPYRYEKFNFDDCEEGSIFLADRLSGNTGSSIYRWQRSYIFRLFYSEIVKNNNTCTLLLMVRKEKHNKQLLKYLNMGFVLIGSTLHKEKEHTIIAFDLRKAQRYDKKNKSIF
jgi:hypothetical protein